MGRRETLVPRLMNSKLSARRRESERLTHPRYLSGNVDGLQKREEGKGRREGDGEERGGRREGGGRERRGGERQEKEGRRGEKEGKREGVCYVRVNGTCASDVFVLPH